MLSPAPCPTRTKPGTELTVNAIVIDEIVYAATGEALQAEACVNEALVKGLYAPLDGPPSP
jgi:hypothetical protein